MKTMDEKDVAIEPTQLGDDELEEAVGGRMATPKTGPKPKTADPCAGGE